VPLSNDERALALVGLAPPGAANVGRAGLKVAIKGGAHVSPKALEALARSMGEITIAIKNLGVKTRAELGALTKFTEKALKSRPLTEKTMTRVEAVKAMGHGEWTKVFEHGYNPHELLEKPELVEKLKKDLKVPIDWVAADTRRGGGVNFTDPAKGGHDYTRVMPGDPKSPHPNSQKPFIRLQKDGRPFDSKGFELRTDAGEAAHIPLDKFKMPESWTKLRN
jgi:hypothetical protein